MSEDDKKRDRALQRRVRERQAKTGESYQAAWRQLTGSDDAPAEDARQFKVDDATAHDVPQIEVGSAMDAESASALLDAWQKLTTRQREALDAARAKLAPRYAEVDTKSGAATRFVLTLHLPLVLPRQPTRVATRAKEGAVDLDRIFISGAGTGWGANDWVVNDIEIDGRSQLTLKDLSGALFGTRGVAANPKATTTFAIEGFDTVEYDHELALIVTYVGPNPEGASFYASAIGTAPPQRPTIIPIASSSPLLFMTKTTIGARIENTPFQVERIEIEESWDWLVHDVRINGRTQFMQAGDIPGDMFAVAAIDSFVSWERCEAGGEIEVDVTYIGLAESVIFKCRLEGTVVCDDHSTPPSDLSVIVRMDDTPPTKVVGTCNWRPRPIRNDAS